MRLYHRSSHWQEILSRGFRDRVGTYMTGRRHRGVWLSDMDFARAVGSASAGSRLLVIEIPARDVRQYEWIQDGLGYREWLIPARVVNRYGRPRLLRRSIYDE